MFDLMNYEQGIHPDCGKIVEIEKDIIITPFYTEAYCDALVDLAKFYDDKFEQYIRYMSRSGDSSNNSPWNTLFFSRISQLLFEDFCCHYKKYLVPAIEKNFEKGLSPINGWFSPFIIKYDQPEQMVNLHNDHSLFTMNVKLNTDFKGSELVFPRQGWSNKDIPKGWCFLWPSDVTHPHQSKPLISGVKYTLASWTHPCIWNPNDNGGSIYSTDVKI